MINFNALRHLASGLALSLTVGLVTGTAISSPSEANELPPQLAQATVAFSDISGNLYEAEIIRAAQLGLIAGPGDGTFRPNNTVTREQAVSIILAYGGVTDAATSEATNPFTDVPAGRWSADKIAYAAQIRIVAGRGDGRFDPTATVTRAELMSMLDNAQDFFEQPREPFPEPNFTFSDMTGHWAADTVAWMAQFCGGVARPLNEAGNAFAPDAGATRAYTAAAVTRLADCADYENGTAPSGAIAPDVSQPPPPETPQVAGAINQTTITALLEAHNRYRAEVGVPPLTWSPTLAAGAQAWADALVFEHSSGSGVGENLAVDVGSDASLSSILGLVDNWAVEKNNNYIPGIPFSEARNQASGVIGHYTQMVWRETTEVGCGVARGVHRDGNGGVLFPSFVDQAGNPVPGNYLVCRYSPQGNILNQVPY